MSVALELDSTDMMKVQGIVVVRVVWVETRCVDDLKK
jgi:hypothetical protein